MPRVTSGLVPALGRRTAVVALTATLSLALAAPVHAVADISEDEVLSTPGRQLIHVRIQRACDDLIATDRLEVQIPDGVYAVLAEAKPGWMVEIETSEVDEYEVFGQTMTERVTAVRWSGGSIDHGEFLDFGIYAVFTETQEELAIPVTQGCGTVEQAWVEVPDDDQDRDELEWPAPTVDVVEPPGTQIAALQAAIDALRSDLDQLASEVSAIGSRVEDLPGPALRQRVADAEDRLDAIEAMLREMSEG
jgi:periplasmic copper chaperone A